MASCATQCELRRGNHIGGTRLPTAARVLCQRSIAHRGYMDHDLIDNIFAVEIVGGITRTYGTKRMSPGLG